jgi:hypothetical protein
LEGLLSESSESERSLICSRVILGMVGLGIECTLDFHSNLFPSGIGQESKTYAAESSGLGWEGPWDWLS